MEQLDILVEEKSMMEVLRIILPQVLPDGWELNRNVFIRPHEGKRDLQDSIPRKLKAARHGNIRKGFVIVQDQDSNECKALKAKLVAACNDALGRDSRIPFSVRIVCHELESWYMGDMDAIKQVFPRFDAERNRNRAIFRNPDSCINPKIELKRLLGDYGQIMMARSIAPHMSLAYNTSRSFHCFLEGVQKVIDGLERDRRTDSLLV